MEAFAIVLLIAGNYISDNFISVFVFKHSSKVVTFYINIL